MNTIFRDTLKEENNMSAIIAACGVKFCAFIADLRVVTFDENDNPKFANDHTQKIFKLNDNILFGATGRFDGSEGFFSPLRCFSNFEGLTITAVCPAVKDYMSGNMEILKRNKARTYLIGGKDSRGNYTLRVIKFDESNNKIVDDDYTPISAVSTSYVLALPSQAKLQEPKFTLMMEEVIRNATTIQDVADGARAIIREIAKVDSTVSERSMALGC